MQRCVTSNSTASAKTDTHTVPARPEGNPPLAHVLASGPERDGPSASRAPKDELPNDELASRWYVVARAAPFGDARLTTQPVLVVCVADAQAAAHPDCCPVHRARYGCRMPQRLSR